MRVAAEHFVARKTVAQEPQPISPGDRVRWNGHRLGTVKRIMPDGTADVRDDGTIIGRRATWRIRVEALTQVPGGA
jgi:hypothetical protein